jgi:hypothetical protein
MKTGHCENAKLEMAGSFREHFKMLFENRILNRKARSGEIIFHQYPNLKMKYGFQAIISS